MCKIRKLFSCLRIQSKVHECEIHVQGKKALDQPAKRLDPLANSIFFRVF